MTVRIPLTKGLFAVVDAEDAEKVKPYPWRATHRRRSVYAVTTVTTESGRKDILMHRLIRFNGAATSSFVDHANGNGLDNRKCNLRECTCAENTRNKKTPISTNKSGCTGVYWKTDKNRWCATIIVNNKKIYLGQFKEKDAAIAARKFAEVEHYGEFAP